MIVCSVVKIMFCCVKASGTVFWRPLASYPSSLMPLSSPSPRTSSLASFTPISMGHVLDKVAQGRGEQRLVSEKRLCLFQTIWFIFVLIPIQLNRCMVGYVNASLSVFRVSDFEERSQPRATGELGEDVNYCRYWRNTGLICLYRRCAG